MKITEKPILIGGRISLLPEKIIMLEAEVNYTRLYLHDGQHLVVATTLKTLEKRFVICENFFRSNRSFIVNLNYLTDYKADKQEITMKNKRVIQISRRRKKDFQKIIASTK